MSLIKFNSATPGLAVAAEWDETILDALLRSGAPVPFYCRSGIRGQCKSFLLCGSVEDVGSAPQLLSETEVRQGMVLLCRSRPMTDCEVRPVNAIATTGPPPWPTQSVVEICAPIGSSLVHLRIGTLDANDLFDFRAGQYTRFEGLASALAPQRLFLASRPGLRYVDIYLPADDSMRLAAKELGAGTIVALAAPTGSASLRESETGPVFVVAEKTGLASALGMVDALAISPSASHDFLFLIHETAGGLLAEMLFEKAAEAGIHAVGCTSGDEVAAVLDKTLRALRRDVPEAKPRVYLKAGREMTTAVRHVLLAHGVRPWDTHVDNVGD